MRLEEDCERGRRSIRRPCSALVFLVVFGALVLRLRYGTGFGLTHVWTTTVAESRDGLVHDATIMHGLNDWSQAYFRSTDGSSLTLHGITIWPHPLVSTIGVSFQDFR